MHDADRAVLAQQQLRHRLADDVGAADDDRLAAGEAIGSQGLAQQVQAAVGRAGDQQVVGQGAAAGEQPADVERVEAVHVLLGQDRMQDGVAVDLRRQRQLDQDAVGAPIAVERVDPLFHGIRGSVREMERQVAEWGAVSFKFYKAHGPRLAWKADDRDIAYPLWEKAQKLGISHVQFHCGLPFGTERVEDLRPNDIQAAAADFPDLIFVIHHLGLPYLDETINIAGRFENVWLSLSSIVFNTWAVSPWDTYTRLGTVLRSVGNRRVLWGSESFIWPDVQPLIDLFAGMRMPEELQDRYGFPEISDEAKRNIFGLNQARLLGIDVERKQAELAAKPRPAKAA